MNSLQIRLPNRQYLGHHGGGSFYLSCSLALTWPANQHVAAQQLPASPSRWQDYLFACYIGVWPGAAPGLALGGSVETGEDTL